MRSDYERCGQCEENNRKQLLQAKSKLIQILEQQEKGQRETTK